MSPQSPLETYFADFGAQLSRVAEAHGVAIEALTIDPRVAAAVLELAGTVAHSGERKFAPLASFITGVAVGSLRSADKLRTVEEVAAFVAEVTQRLDTASDGSGINRGSSPAI